MSFTLKDIEGAVIEKKEACDECCTMDECVAVVYVNKAIDTQCSVKLRFNRDKLAKLIWYEREVMPPDMGYWEATRQSTKDKYLKIADSIIAAEREIIEVEK